MFFVRLTLALALSVVAALGHAPFWLHFASCCGSAQPSGTLRVGELCCDSCPTSDVEFGQSPAYPLGRGEDSNLPCESDSCAVCLSAASAVGVARPDPGVLVYERVARRTTIHVVTLLPQTQSSVVRTRGPPSMI